MSRYFQMNVKVSEFNPDRKHVIQNAADEEWDWEDWSIFKPSQLPAPMSASGTGNLCAGESEEEFALRLTRAIWKANGAQCRVEVDCIYLEDPPRESFDFTDRYENLKE